MSNLKDATEYAVIIFLIVALISGIFGMMEGYFDKYINGCEGNSRMTRVTKYLGYRYSYELGCYLGERVE
jgi:hypothetical protein